MLIKTKYDVGHTFWVPRCTVDNSVEYMDIDGEVWSRRVKTYTGYAKKKKIIKIIASTYKSVNPVLNIQYYILDAHGKNNQMSQVYSENDINDYTEQEAYNIAMEYQEKKEEYYGN